MLKLDSIFSQLKDFSGLKTDTVLVEEEQPILFTCTDSKNNVYLVLCPFANAEYMMWYLTKTDYRVLIGLLQNKITIYDAFKAVSDKKYVVVYNKDGISSECVPFESLDDDYLPIKGEFMDAEADEYRNEVILFQSRINTEYFRYYVKATKSIVLNVEISEISYEKYSAALRELDNNIKTLDFTRRICYA